MNFDTKITRQQALEKIRVYEQLFDVVRILDSSAISRISKGFPPDGAGVDCPCYSFWGKSEHCENCISLKAFQAKGQLTKFEFQNDDIYYVISQYVEIDSHPSIIEFVKKLEDDPFINDFGRKKFINKLIHFDSLLYQDALTKVLNRRYYEDKIKNHRETAGIAVLDLDDFKLYNDHFGHKIGDSVLITAASEIQNCISGKDKLIRFGGDEFLLIAANVKEDSFAMKLQLIKERLAEISIEGFPQIKLSVSIGGVICNNELAEDAINRADKLMYFAKNGQKKIVIENHLSLPGSGKALLSAPTPAARHKVLIVDDSPLNRELLSQILASDFDTIEAENGRECLRILNEYRSGISLVLLDIVMPVMNGFEVLDAMNENRLIDDVPVIMISADSTDVNIRKAYEMGVSDYILRPFDGRIVSRRVDTIIKSHTRQRRLLSILSEQMNKKDRFAKMMTEILSQIVEFRNGESRLHTIHISLLTEMLIKQLMKKTDKYTFTPEDISRITAAASLHDIGKIGIPESILNKPSRLTPEEFEIAKQHTVIGERILSGLTQYADDPLVTESKQICRWHHERYDGSGYPDQLSGDDIPIAAQIVSVADVYDALASKRAYKEAFSYDRCVQMIADGECGQFNPLLVECIVELKDSIHQLYSVEHSRILSDDITDHI